MDTNYIKQQVVELGKRGPVAGLAAITGWYQELDLDGVKTHPGNPLADIHIFHAIRGLAPNIGQMRVLDVGASAGLHSANAALLGADVTSIEKVPHFVDQSKFVRTFYSSKQPLKWNILQGDVTNGALDRLGYFDLIICIALIPFLNCGLSADRKSRPVKLLHDEVAHSLTSLSDFIILSYGEVLYHTDWCMTALMDRHKFSLCEEIQTDILTLGSFRRTKS